MSITFHLPYSEKQNWFQDSGKEESRRKSFVDNGGQSARVQERQHYKKCMFIRACRSLMKRKV